MAPNPEQKAALDSHNKARARHGCPPLQWDDFLTSEAEKWAEHLAQIGSMVHSDGDQRKGVNVPPPPPPHHLHAFPTPKQTSPTPSKKEADDMTMTMTMTMMMMRHVTQGENLAWFWSSDQHAIPPLSKGVQDWLNEEAKYHGEKIGEGNFHDWGHYTQCVWKSTTHVGVAKAKDAKGGWYTVGRYSPAGNIGGQKPY
ncbi:MAG: hypothetical protein M1836_000074 [Candelina mexicana]|nr:MAG: hypothetical protein M1836_000074 [Candelina mexicana]